MARRSSNNSNTSNPAFTQADAFLRLSLVDAEGNEHRLPKDIALYIKNFVSEQIIKAAESSPGKEFSFKGTVHVVDNSPKEDIKL